MALLASILITANALFWTLDKRLVHLAQRVHVAFAAA